MVMEVFTLGVGERLVLDDHIYVTVVAIEGEEVHVEVSPPESVQGEGQGADEHQGAAPSLLRRLLGPGPTSWN
jgi:hypothetical protein